MAVTAYVQPTIIESMFADYFTGKTIKAMLLTASHTYSLTDEFVADVVTNEVAGGGYARQTVTLDGETVADDEITVDATGTVTFLAVPDSFQFIGIYEFVTNDADSKLACVIDMGEAVVCGGLPFAFNLAQILKGTV